MKLNLNKKQKELLAQKLTDLSNFIIMGMLIDQLFGDHFQLIKGAVGVSMALFLYAYSVFSFKGDK